MADKPDKTTPAKQPVIIDAPHAPFIYFDGISTYGPIHGGTLMNIQITAERFSADHVSGVVKSEHVVIANLRCPAFVAAQLRDAINSAALVAATPRPESKEKGN